MLNPKKSEKADYPDFVMTACGVWAQGCALDQTRRLMNANAGPLLKALQALPHMKDGAAKTQEVFESGCTPTAAERAQRHVRQLLLKTRQEGKQRQAPAAQQKTLSTPRNNGQPAKKKNGWAPKV